MSSCFLLTTQDDSIEGIYSTLKKCAQISKSAGGIGVSISGIRATGSYIRGTPYMLYKDHCNGKSNQKNLGTIRCSNLCTEILEFTSPDEVAVCNLASVALPAFVSEDGGSY